MHPFCPLAGKCEPTTNQQENHMETSDSANAPKKKKKKINALIIVGVVLMFAGGPFTAPLKYILWGIGAVLAIAGFIKARKDK